MLPLADVLAIADQVLDVLAAFHARDVIHRDIKPGNLFVTKPGLVKVLDFGLARLRDPKFTGAPTATGIVLGTASYMPPEQAQGKSDQVDARSDIFAVGAIMFRALTGRAVHDGEGRDRAALPGDEGARAVARHRRAAHADVGGRRRRQGARVRQEGSLGHRGRHAQGRARDVRAAARKQAAAREACARRARARARRRRVEVSEIFDAMLEPSIIVDVSFGDVRDRARGSGSARFRIAQSSALVSRTSSS